jgi:putative ABC transport system permease protein
MPAMNWNIRPILSALWRNRTGAVLVALQIAIALAVLVNAVYVVKQRVDKITRPTGMDTDNMLVVASLGFAREFDYLATLRDDLAYLRGVPGVIAATPINALPLSGGGSSTGIDATPHAKDSQPANYFEVDEQGVAALGITLSEGRSFRADEILPPSKGSKFVPQVIVSKALGKALFPDGRILGRTVYDALQQPATIIGVIDHMHGAWVDWDKLDHVMLTPQIASGPRAFYVVRTAPGQRDQIIRQVEEHLSTSNPMRLLIWVRPYDMFSRRSYLADRNMAIFLGGVTAALLAITALGIFGLATFNVSTRTRQIGTRRAVGARRLDIVRHFLVENWLVTTVGVVAGCALALGVGYWLSINYQLPRLDLYYLVGGVLAVWVLGQLAAWQPARRAALVSPAVATRTV